MAHIDRPEHNDNRNYVYRNSADSKREEHSILVDWVESGASVIDLGCGDGALLDLLRREKQCRGQGVDGSSSGVELTQRKGIAASCKAIDQGLPEYQNKQFDYAICNVTLQMVMYPERLLEEMGRIGKKQIVSFPNFGYYRNRLDLLFRGRMPQKSLFGYKWYSTGHIHQLSMQDFEDYCAENGFRVLKSTCVLKGNSLRRAAIRLMPKWFGVISVYLLEKTEEKK